MKKLLKSKTFWLVYAVVIITLALTSCRSEKRRVIVVTVDFSYTISNEVLISNVRTIVEQIVPNLGDYDRLVIIPIDEASRTHPTKIIDIDLQGKSFSGQYDGFAHAADSIAKRRQKFLDGQLGILEESILRTREIRHEYGKYTDIFSALKEVELLQENTLPDKASFEDVLDGKPVLSSENIVIMLSDMVHECSRYNFAWKHKAGYGDRVLRQLQEDNDIADLSGAKVIIHGRTGKDNEQVENLLSFWTAYFEQAGAELVAYEYDGRPYIRQVLQEK